MVKTRSSREAGLTMLEVVIATVILTVIVGMASWLVWSASAIRTNGFLTPWSLQGYSRVSPRGRPFGSPRLFGWGPPASSMPDDPDAPIAVSPGLTISQ